MSKPIIYLARDAEALHEGTFYKVCKYGVSRYINGDYLGLFPKGTPVPTVDGDGVPLLAFPRMQAKRILPACCV